MTSDCLLRRLPGGLLQSLAGGSTVLGAEGRPHSKRWVFAVPPPSVPKFVEVLAVRGSAASTSTLVVASPEATTHSKTKAPACTGRLVNN